MNSEQRRKPFALLNGTRTRHVWVVIARFALSLLGLTAVPASNASIEQLAVARAQLEQRVLAARAILHTGSVSHSEKVNAGCEMSSYKLAQWWGNWPNWNNWGNWSNYWFNR